MAAAVVSLVPPAWAGHLASGVSPGNVPWPGGTVPYVIDPVLSAAQQQAYLDGLREWELAGNIHFIPRTTETDYAFFTYDPNGPNTYSGSQPQTVEINALTRAQICHEMGHSLGLLHEQTRNDRGTYITVNPGNITSGNESWFDIDNSGTPYGAYDFESVMHFAPSLYSIDPETSPTMTANAGYERYQARMGNFAISPGDRATIAYLYGAVTLSPVVTTTADAGPGSLRAAIYYATDHSGTTISFNIPTSDPGYGGGVFTIHLTGYMPPLVTNGTVIDATTQPGYAGNPLVFIDGANVLPESGEPPGLMVYAGNCTIKGLGFTHARWVGMALLYPDATGNTISSCWSGVDPAGNTAAANAKQGIQISGGAHDNTIGPGNLLSGNTEYGVWISDADTTGNTVTGNLIGTDHTGSAALPNGQGGVIVADGAHGNAIGEGNVLSGNTNAGVWLSGAGVTDNTVSGNLIGTDAAGSTALPNSFAGVYIVDGASNNHATGNVISGNANEGLRIADAGSTGNVVSGNLVGVDAAETMALGNGFAGLTVFNGASGNTFSGNVVAGNNSYGVVIGDAGSDGNRVDGNLIGLLRNGAPLGNSFTGLSIWGGAQANTVSSNLIRHNGTYGIILYDAATAGNTFSANSISGNGFAGIWIDPANHNQAAPDLTSATAENAGLAVAGALSSTPDASFRIEFFANPSGDPEGRVFLGALDGVTTDPGGDANFSTTLAAAVLPGREITATATDEATGDTSAFSFSINTTATDTDNDGMPDDYETAHGLTVGIDDSALDADGDGAPNRLEYLAGTDPQNGADVFKATSVTRSGDDIIVTFHVTPGRVYQVWESGTLSPGSWRILVPARQATTNELPVTAPFSAGRHFYRATLMD